MVSKILGTLAIVIYALVVPILELNATHLFNPEWAPHARTHEAWQLITNSCLGLFAMCLLWQRDKAQMANIITVIVMGSFLLAFALQDTYGGSMVLSSSHPEKKIFGINLGVCGAALSVILATSSILFNKKRGALG